MATRHAWHEALAGLHLGVSTLLHSVRFAGGGTQRCTLVDLLLAPTAQGCVLAWPAHSKPDQELVREAMVRLSQSRPSYSPSPVTAQQACTNLRAAGWGTRGGAGRGQGWFGMWGRLAQPPACELPQGKAHRAWLCRQQTQEISQLGGSATSSPNCADSLHCLPGAAAQRVQAQHVGQLGGADGPWQVLLVGQNQDSS